jgi:hypothetical protein
MPRWLLRALTRIRTLAAAERVVFTLKARRELATLAFRLEETDARDILARLATEDSVGRVESVSTGEWMYLFKPSFGGTTLYLKVIVRSRCILVSFHEDEGGGHEEDGG